jgi:membrane-bound lytic murein transglycosylase B
VLATIVGITATSAVADSGFQSWLEMIGQRAEAQGISPDFVDLAFRGLKPSKDVLRLQRKQPEFTETLASYLDRVLPPSRIATGRRRLRQHRELLEEIGAEYGVQPRFIVALWAIESDFGRFQGQHRTVQSLATLGFGGRRKQFFQRELLHLLQLLEQEGMRPAELSGSWAGALGQCQFMPSTFRSLAVDYDGDGHRDIWSNHGDIFASIANFLSHLGWRDDQTWGRQVSIPADIERSLAGLKMKKSLATWQSLGVRRADGTDLPERDIDASLLLPKRGGGRAYLVYKDFRILLKWNNSTYSALSVGRLADRLRSP